MGFEWFVDVSAVFSQPIAVPKDVSYFYQSTRPPSPKNAPAQNPKFFIYIFYKH